MGGAMIGRLGIHGITGDAAAASNYQSELSRALTLRSPVIPRIPRVEELDGFSVGETWSLPVVGHSGSPCTATITSIGATVLTFDDEPTLQWRAVPRDGGGWIVCALCTDSLGTTCDGASQSRVGARGYWWGGSTKKGAPFIRNMKFSPQNHYVFHNVQECESDGRR